MYSFAELPGIRVVDEPLYGHYLRVSGARHPGGSDVMAAMNCNGDQVLQGLLDARATAPATRLFVKHMAHHLVDIDLGFVYRVCNVFLIRDPVEMLPSLTIQVPHARLADTGLKRQHELFASLVDAGHDPVVLDSRELLLDPASVLRQLCDRIDVAYSEQMLHWEAGPRAEDGVWAPHWYRAVHQSTGFSPYQAKTEFPESLQPLLDECRPWYDKLFANAIRAGDNGE